MNVEDWLRILSSILSRNASDLIKLAFSLKGQSNPAAFDDSEPLDHWIYGDSIMHTCPNNFSQPHAQARIPGRGMAYCSDAPNSFINFSYFTLSQSAEYNAMPSDASPAGLLVFPQPMRHLR